MMSSFNTIPPMRTLCMTEHERTETAYENMKKVPSAVADDILQILFLTWHDLRYVPRQLKSSM